MLLGCVAFLAATHPPAARAAGVYFVKEGDTLSRISRVFGVDVQSLREANRLRNSDLNVGDRLRIPDRAAPPHRAEDAKSRDAGLDRVNQAVCRDETVYHTVAKGDTLFAIARRYTTAVDELLRLNGLRKQARLAIGQKIIVRRTSPRTHTVARGETLGRIAARYRVQAADVTRLNRLDGDVIHPGQRLLIEPCDPYAAAGSAPPPLGDSATAAADAGHVVPDLSSPSADGGDGGGSPTVAGRVISLARDMLGIPYRFGGTTLRGIDCSAYVQRVFGLLDMKLPRTAREQYGVGASIGRDELAIGDLVFFRTYASFPSHVGIYLGDSLFIHASSVVKKVTIDSIDVPYYRKRFLGARRLVTDDAPALASAP